MNSQPVLTHINHDVNREPLQRPLQLGLILRLIRQTHPYLTKRNWLIAIVILRSIQLPLLAAVFAAVIDGPIEQRQPLGLAIGALCFLLLAILEVIVYHFRMRLSLELGEAVVHDLRNDVFEHLQKMPLSFFNRTKLGRVISRITSDIGNVRVGVQEVLFACLVHGGQMIVAAALMLWRDWLLFLLLMGISPLLWTINRYFRPRLSRAHRDVQESFSRVTATLAESVGGIRVTQGFVRQNLNAQMFRELVWDHAGYHVKAQRIQGTFLPLLDLNGQVFFAALLLLGGFRVLNPDSGSTLGDLVYFFLLANMFFDPIIIIGRQYNNALMAMAGAERVFDLLDTKPQWSDQPNAVALNKIQGHIQLDHIEFEYEPGTPVLRGINLTVQPGQTVALVGHTGSGKSTLISLIARFYLPTSGAVLIDGHDSRNIQGESLHKQMGIVLQTNFLFSGTVMDNIRFGNPKANDDQVIAAARNLNCLGIIESMPDGFETQVGEHGSKLSLGQRQLVCFTRAMLANPRILILDEATSAVDTLTEAKLQEALTVLLDGRTSFIVAHRLSTIRYANQVLVLEKGRIAEQGTHNQLIEKKGIYAQLYRQFTWGIEV